MRKTENCQIFTPTYIVNLILNTIGYKGESVINKTIMEPSFGDGAFLVKIVERLILVAKKKGFDESTIKALLLSNIFGIEKNEELYQKTLTRLYKIFNKYDIDNIDMSNNLICGDTILLYSNFKNKFDFVVMNPPYQRNHHCSEEILNSLKQFKYTTGSTDLYIAFYEMALTMLNSTGKLGCIAPNSFMTNTSQKVFRNDLIENRLVSHIFDFKSYKVFDNASTYTCICIMNNTESKALTYRECNEKLGSPIKITYSYLQKHVLNKTWTFGKMMDYVYLPGSKKLKDIGTIQYGVSTNADSIYIGTAYINDALYTGKHTDELQIVLFNGHPIESTLLRRCCKASNGQLGNYILYPYEYDNGYRIISEDVLKNKYPYAYKYLLLHKEALLSRDIDNNIWYAFARSQGLSSMNNKKLSFKHIMKRDGQIVTAFALDEDVVVYSGMYITGTDDNLKKYKDYLETDLFKEYCCFVGKNMANDYISVNGKAVQSFQI
jgi:adenine-specific DNA-methyltransferase